MKIYRFLILLLSAFSFVACGDDEEEKDVSNIDDPRIRAVKIVNISKEFVVNDVECTIYNYDSITKGSDVKDRSVYFYGYTSSPTIMYRTSDSKDWHDFSNGDKINFSDVVEILSVSQDGKNRKEYKFDLRVHKYDVEAFSWTKHSTIELSSEVVSQKSLTMDGKFYWYCRTADGHSYQFESSDKGKSWTRREISVGESMWETLSLFKDSIWVQQIDGSLVCADMDKLEFSSVNSSVSIDRLLFEVNGSLWAISGKDVYALAPDSADFVRKNTLPDDFSLENIATFTAASGFTHLGYIYATAGESGAIWSLDYKGNLCKLQEADGNLPVLKNPMVYIYNKTLGLVGGRLSDGTLSTACYSSYDSGKSWRLDEHKDLSNNIGGVEYAGVFVYSNDGELIIVGGNDSKGPSTIVWKGVLNQIFADDLNYND